MSFIELLRDTASILPLTFLVAMMLLRFAQGADRPRAIADAFLTWAIVSYAATEIFGLLHGIAFLPFLLFWIAIDGWIVYRLWPLRARASEFWRIPIAFPAGILMFALAVTLFIACTAAPNNWDSQTYHLPRIEHWIQDRSLDYYPTPDSRQNELGPLAEILLLQLRVISGSDFLYPLIQWFSMMCSVVVVFRITRQLGGSKAQCWLASVFLVSLPIGILESTSTQNDYVVAALLACFVTLALDAVARPKTSLALMLAAASAAALSGIVKPTGYFSGCGFALWFAYELSRGVNFPGWIRRAAGTTMVLVLAIGPAASRYLAAHHETQTTLSKELTVGSFGVKQTLDNLIRNGMLNFSVGIPDVDRLSNQAIEGITSRLGLDAYRRDTSFGSFLASAPPVGLYAFQEDFGPNLIHSLLLVLAFLATVIRGIRWSMPSSALRLRYCIAWLVGIVVLAAVLRWAPWNVRYQLPLFVLAAPIFATALPERWLSPRTCNGLHFALALVALPPLFFNQSRELLPLVPGRPFPVAWVRPSYLAQTANARLFANHQDIRQPYENAVSVILRTRVAQIGLLHQSNSRWEYPIWRMLREGGLDYPVRIEHVETKGNANYPLGPFVPEAVLWNGEQAPSSIMVDGRKFARVGPSEVVALFFPADEDWVRFGIKDASVWPAPRPPEVVREIAWKSEGILEDGWLAQSGSVVIRAARAGKLVLMGMVPGGIGIDRQQLDIETPLGGLLRRQLDAGPFEIDIPIQTDETELTFRFGKSAILLHGDGRTVGALLLSAQFVPN